MGNETSKRVYEEPAWGYNPTVADVRPPTEEEKKNKEVKEFADKHDGVVIVERATGKIDDQIKSGEINRQRERAVRRTKDFYAQVQEIDKESSASSDYDYLVLAPVLAGTILAGRKLYNIINS